MDETTPNDGSLKTAASLFAGVFSADPKPAEDQHAPESQPEQQSTETAEQAPAAPESSESEQAPSTDEGAEAAESSPPRTYKVKVDGVEVEVPEDELVKGYSRTADYTRKTQELAAQKREFEEKELSAVRQERQQYAETLGKWVDILKAQTPAEPDPTKMEPSEFAVEWVRWKQHTDHVAQAQAEQARVKALQEADAQKGFQQYVQSEQQKLADAIPAFKDPETSKSLKTELVKYAETRGFTASDLEQVTDHRLVVLLHDAMQGAKAKAKAPEIKQRVEKVLESAKPGANPPAGKPDDTKAALKRLRETGRVDDAAKAFGTIFK